MGMKFSHKTSFDNIIILLMNNPSVYEFVEYCIEDYNVRKSLVELCEEWSERWVEICLKKINIKAKEWARDKIDHFKFPLNDTTKEDLIQEFANELYSHMKLEIWETFFADGFANDQ